MTTAFAPAESLTASENLTAAENPTVAKTSSTARSNSSTSSLGLGMVDVAGLAAAIAGGALIVDIRSIQERERQGVFTGALAIPASAAATLLDPQGPSPLTALSVASEVILISSDGVDAAFLAWELQSRTVRRGGFGPSVHALRGGFDALLAANGLRLLAAAAHVRRESAAISAH